MFNIFVVPRYIVVLILSTIYFISSIAHADVFISEYIEGSASNKAIEIYNGNTTAVNLGNYSIQMYFNGSTSLLRSIALSGNLAASGTYVLAHGTSDPVILAVANQTDSGSWFNGDDVVVLLANGVVVDAIGQVGFDPGTQWGSGLVSTANNTLQRKSEFCVGDTITSDVFDPLTQWNGFTSDTFTGLGNHAPSCLPGTPPVTQSVFIHQIQGNGPVSPLLAASVKVEAIVTADFQTTGQLKGFYIQEEDIDADTDAKTSEGIFVFTDLTSVAVNVGDRVSVTGIVQEFFELTELTSVTVSIVNSGNPLPAVTNINLPLTALTDLESFEGMYVSLPQILYVTENYNLSRFGEFWLSSGARLMQPTNVTTPGLSANNQQTANDLNRILINDASTIQNPDPVIYPSSGLSANNTLRSGSTVANVTGVMHFDFSQYHINPTQAPFFSNINTRMDPAPAVVAPLRVAAFNVLNYFNGDGVGGSFPTSRGADTLTEFTRQRDKIINSILGLGADIIGLMEIENDGYDATSAIQDLVNGLNSVAPVGTSYAFINPGLSQIGTDAIAVGLLYRVQTVTPIGGAVILDSSVDPTFIDTKNRPVLVQTFEHLVSNDRLTIAVNHLKSKGSACVSDPDTLDGQGNCNLTRASAAQALVNWLATDPTTSSSTDNLIIGDLNSYAMEDPITAIKAAGYTDLINMFEVASKAYTFNFKGQSGYLDHALASTSLAAKIVGATIWHINADEPRALDYNVEFKTAGQITSFYSPDTFRSSDHDPVLVDIKLTDPTITNPDGSVTTNINATRSNETFIQLTAGEYQINLVNPALNSNALFSAWSPDGVNWSTSFTIVDSAGLILLTGGQDCVGGTADACFQATTPLAFTLTIAADELLFIKLPDTNLSNNSGGLSVVFSPVITNAMQVNVPMLPDVTKLLFALFLILIAFVMLRKKDMFS